MPTRALLASPLGFLIGLSLGALGGGGSILAVPVLVYVAGQDVRDATTSSLVLVGLASLIGTVPHWRAGRVRLGTGLVFGCVGVGGSLAGSALNRRLDPDVLLLGFSALVLVAAWRMLTACPTCTKVGEEQELRLAPAPDGRWVRTRTPLTAGRVALVVAAGSAVGFLTGLFGVGGGFVIVPALTLVLKMPMPEAIGTSLVVITVNTTVALAARLATSSIDWAVTLPFAVAAIAGVLVGGRVADRLDPERSLRAFAALLVAVAIYTATSAIVALV
ncbi:MAG: UPF0721 transmembrane protein [Acidimicrobiia bacterium]|nr:MAG: UPF0721 transmembrane protein [Acidimicrobiia bacterium]